MEKEWCILFDRREGRIFKRWCEHTFRVYAHKAGSALKIFNFWKSQEGERIRFKKLYVEYKKREVK